MAELSEQLVKDTFEKEFDEFKYRKFLSELSGKSINKSEDKTQQMSEGFKNYINSVKYYGNYTDEEYESIGFYIIELKKTTSLSRARTMQRNVIAHFLRQSSDDCALVAFFEKDTPNWRFSFASIDYELDEKGKIREKLTPAKRHSFLVGPDEPNYTCKKQFFDLLAHGKILVKNIENAFNIENVTEEFFNEYKNLFYELVDALNEIIENDQVVAEEFKNKHIKVSDFAKKLLGQIVFLYFVQKKGWLGIPKEGTWGDGPKNFMRKLLNGDYIQYKKDKFFDDVIEPLFYQGLSEGVSDYHYSQFNCKIPFLNGGLFENLNGYDWQNTDLVIPDEIFAKIFSVFDKFNFTVKEDEPLDKEVAVDPEMLGKVFENLLEVNDRKSKGAFYTPRHIVHFMCQQTLISYLDSNTDNIPTEEIKEFIENGHLALDSIIRVQEEENNDNIYENIKLPKSIIDNAILLDELLSNVKVVDPAVGSGAFPVGMMLEIVQAREVLNTLQNYDTYLYDLKRETIENSLYGIDISSSAVDITKLRFWLSLIVDEKDMKNIRPLPNLDNHIMCGNSLKNTFKDVKLFNERFKNGLDSQTTLTMTGSEIAFRRLSKLKRMFFNENNQNEKQKIKTQINDIKWNFIEESFKESCHYTEIDEIKQFKNVESRPFFVWELEFSEIFKGDNPGFDIVIGNPPYIKEAVEKSAFDGLRNSPYYQGKMDLWTFFGCMALDHVKNNGCIGFIAPNAWITAAGASKFRNKVAKEGQIMSFIDFGEYKVFKSASIQTMIYFMRKNNSKEVYEMNYSILNKDKLLEEDILEFLTSDKINDNYKKYTSIFDRKENENSYFTFLDKKINSVINNIKNQDDLLYLNKNEVSTGIDVHQDFLTQKNAKKFGLENLIGAGIFIVNEYELNSLNLSKEEKKLIKPYYTTDNIYRFYGDNKNDLWIIYTKSDINKKINNYPNIRKHFDRFKEVITSDNGPYGLHRARDENLFLNEKIIVTRKCKKPTFSYVDFDSYVSQTFNIIKSNRIDLKYLTGILNSKLIQFWLRYQGKMQGHNYQLDQKPLLNIPIKYNENNNEFNRRIIDIVEEIIRLNKENENDLKITEIKKLENELNALVYEYYNISPSEINTIEENLKE